jgi:hypothetical protein
VVTKCRTIGYQSIPADAKMKFVQLAEMAGDY